MKSALYILLKVAAVMYSAIFFLAVNFSIVSAVRFVLSGAETSTGQFWVGTALAGVGALVAILLAFLALKKEDPK